MNKFFAMIGGALLSSPALTGAIEFSEPRVLMAGDEPVRVESPGYAAPGLGDIDGDGKPELLVGQFRNGKIQVFRRGDGLAFEKGVMLRAGGEVAEVPGVW